MWTWAAPGVFPCMPWNTQDSANKHKYIYIVYGSGTMAKASPAPAIVALRRASQPTTKKLMACMHWHCSTESFCSASASLQLSAERKRKKSFSFYSSRETEWQAARSVPHLGTACIHACHDATHRAFINTDSKACPPRKTWQIASSSSMLNASFCIALHAHGHLFRSATNHGNWQLGKHDDGPWTTKQSSNNNKNRGCSA